MRRSRCSVQSRRSQDIHRQRRDRIPCPVEVSRTLRSETRNAAREPSFAWGHGQGGQSKGPSDGLGTRCRSHAGVLLQPTTWHFGERSRRL